MRNHSSIGHPHPPTRRELLRAALVAATFGLGPYPLTSFGFPAPQEEETLVPFLDPQPVKPDRPMLQWEQLQSWITPLDQFFTVKHYGIPEAAPENWSLEIRGLVNKPKVFTLAQIKGQPRHEYFATLECAGNGVGPGFMGAIGNARWAGALLAPLLEEAGLQQEAREVVFFGADKGTETIRKQEFQQNFARSLPLGEALNSQLTLVYEMNHEPLPKQHGGPVRLGVPGAYGVAWVKWLDRIEVHDRRFAGRFMARDYVTIRGEPRGDEIVWTEKLVTRMNLKSIVARVVRRPDRSLHITGAAWNDGSVPLKSIEIRIDNGPWQRAHFGEGLAHPYSWKFWSYDWKEPEPGEHTLVSRAIDEKGNIQPAAEEPEIALKKTYWEANQQVPRRIQI